MSEVIQFPGTTSKTINTKTLGENTRKLRAGMIAPAACPVEHHVVEEHAAEPIKKMEDIIRISQYFIQRGQYRDNMLFIVGINFGLRISDLLSLKFSHLITDDFSFRDSFAILEKKTENTRKKKRNRHITINKAVMEAVTLYLENTPGVTLGDYMFRSESNRGKNTGAPLSRMSVERILKKAVSDLEIPVKAGTHCLRKTFCLHQMMMSGNDPRKLLLLQKMLGHSTSAQTLDYIGLTEEEMGEAYRNLNLGSLTDNYLIDSKIVELSVG